MSQRMKKCKTWSQFPWFSMGNFLLPISEFCRVTCSGPHRRHALARYTRVPLKDKLGLLPGTSNSLCPGFSSEKKHHLEARIDPNQQENIGQVLYNRSIEEYAIHFYVSWYSLVQLWLYMDMSNNPTWDGYNYEGFRAFRHKGLGHTIR